MTDHYADVASSPASLTKMFPLPPRARRPVRNTRQHPRIDLKLRCSLNPSSHFLRRTGSRPPQHAPSEPMRTAEIIERKLSEAFSPKSLRVEDESHQHEGHAGHR